MTALGNVPALKILAGLGLLGVLALVFIERISAIESLAFAVALLGGAALIVVRPYLGVVVILGAWITDFEPIGVKFLSITYLITACLLIPLALALIRDRGVWVLRVPQVHLLFALALVFFTGTLWSWVVYPVTPLPELDETARMLQLFVGRFVFLILFLYFVSTPGRITTVVWSVVGLIVVTALDGLMGFESGEVRRASSSFGLGQNANRLGFICVFALSFVWFYRRYGPNPRIKVMTLPLLFVLPLCAAATSSRSAFLQMLALAALMVRDRGGWSQSKRASALAVLVVVALLVALLIPTANIMRATTYDPSVHAPGQESLQNRIRRVQAALDVVVSNPVVGIGIGNFHWIYRTQYGLGGQPHNSYLWAATAGGLGALALYLLLFFVTARMLRRLERAGPLRLLWVSKALRTNLLLFLLFSAFADFWLSEFLYVIVGLAIAMTYLDRRMPIVSLVQQGARPRVAHA